MTSAIVHCIELLFLAPVLLLVDGTCSFLALRFPLFRVPPVIFFLCYPVPWAFSFLAGIPAVQPAGYAVSLLLSILIIISSYTPCYSLGSTYLPFLSITPAEGRLKVSQSFYSLGHFVSIFSCRPQLYLM